MFSRKEILKGALHASPRDKFLKRRENGIRNDLHPHPFTAGLYVFHQREQRFVLCVGIGLQENRFDDDDERKNRQGEKERFQSRSLPVAGCQAVIAYGISALFYRAYKNSGKNENNRNGYDAGRYQTTGKG